MNQDLLIQALNNLGNYFALSNFISTADFECELKKFEAHWTHIDPLTETYSVSLGAADMEALPSLVKGGVTKYLPFARDVRLVRLGHGGFLQSRPFGVQTEKIIRLVAPMTHCDIGSFGWLVNDERVFLEKGTLYYINSEKSHAAFSFGFESVFLEVILDVTAESVHHVSSCTFAF